MPPAAARARSKLLTHGAPVLALVTAGFAGLVHLQSGKLEVRVSVVDGGEGKGTEADSWRCRTHVLPLPSFLSQSAHKRALELGPTGTNALDLEAEAEVRERREERKRKKGGSLIDAHAAVGAL